MRDDPSHPGKPLRAFTPSDNHSPDRRSEFHEFSPMMKERLDTLGKYATNF
jgi:hypothetical protein